MSEKRYYGYKTRPPFAGEDSYFKANPGVGGMAAEDDQIVLNPYSKLKPDEMDQVAKNEGLRIYMRQTGGDMDFDLTPEQSAMFQGTAYGDPANINQAKRTIISRILTGDPSAGIATASQQKWAEGVLAGASANEEKLLNVEKSGMSKFLGDKKTKLGSYLGGSENKGQSKKNPRLKRRR